MRTALLLLALIGLIAPVQAQLSLDVAFPTLSFAAPIDFEYADDGSNRLYVAERSGTVQVFENDEAVASSTTFLDIQSQVSTTGEGGLLGLAFHPDYAGNGYLYVSYTTSSPFRSRIARFTRSETDPEQVDPASELVLLEIPQPFSNHNGGDLAFGPDGHLYASFGDGGSGGDPEGNGQDPTTLLGAILRLDVDGGGTDPDCGGPDANYTVPDNALADGPGGDCDEVYAYGLRNPFRFSFDRQTGVLWVGDVGQGTWEEVDNVGNGGNYGWNTKEGPDCYPPTGPQNCDQTGLLGPVWFYGRSQGNSITGGFVYRGSDVPELVGRYVYADFGSGRIWALTATGAGSPENVELFDTNLSIPSFGEDANGELYLTAFNGNVYRFSSESDTSSEDGTVEEGASFGLDGPNPFRGQTALAFQLAVPGRARVAVYDVLGREVAVLHDGPVEREETQVRFEAAGLPAGLYFVRLEADGVSQTRKVVLAR